MQAPHRGPNAELACAQVATAAGMRTAWSDKEIQYQIVAGPGDPLELSDRITDTFFPAIDYLLNKLVRSSTLFLRAWPCMLSALTSCIPAQAPLH